MGAFVFGPEKSWKKHLLTSNWQRPPSFSPGKRIRILFVNISIYWYTQFKYSKTTQKPEYVNQMHDIINTTPSLNIYHTLKPKNIFWTLIEGTDYSYNAYYSQHGFLWCIRILLVAGFSMLISGTLANSSARKSCGIANHRLLSIGGVLCFIHGLFIVAYYVSATATVKEEKKAPQHRGNAWFSKILFFFFSGHSIVYRSRTMFHQKFESHIFHWIFSMLKELKRMLNARGTNDGKQRFAIPMLQYQKSNFH